MSRAYISTASQHIWEPWKKTAGHGLPPIWLGRSIILPQMCIMAAWLGQNIILKKTLGYHHVQEIFISCSFRKNPRNSKNNGGIAMNTQD